MSNIDRRGFITISTAAAAALLLGPVGPESWVHRGVLIRTDREPGKVIMSYRQDGKTYGLGFVHESGDGRKRRMERALRMSVKATIDEQTGFDELAELKAQFARVAA